MSVNICVQVLHDYVLAYDIEIEPARIFCSFYYRCVAAYMAVHAFFLQLASGTCTTITLLGCQEACLVDCRLLHNCKLTSRRPIMLINAHSFKILGFYMYASINRGHEFCIDLQLIFMSLLMKSREYLSLFYSFSLTMGCYTCECACIIDRVLYNNNITELPSTVFSGLWSLKTL